MTDTVLLDVTDGVATITLNRPDALNALTVEAKLGLKAAVDEVAGDPRARALVLTGAGRAFCAGQDLREHGGRFTDDDPDPLSTVAEHYNPIVSALAGLPLPTVGALNGTAAGAGLGIACALDLRLAAAGARFTTAFANIGLTADSGLSWTLQRLVGYGRAMALMLLAEPFTAEQALDMGLVNAVVPADRVLPAAQELAGRLAQGPTAGYAAIKAAMSFSATASLADALQEEDRLQTLAGHTEDHVNAVRSFLAKEQPVFTGR